MSLRSAHAASFPSRRTFGIRLAGPVVGLLLSCSACAGEPGPRPPLSAATSDPSVGPAAASAVAVQVTPPVASPDIELIDRDRARAGGQIVAFDGVAEGLAWPSLAKALQGRSHGAAVHVQAGRVVRVLDVMRAVWTVRGSEVVVQTQDAAARLRAVSLGVAPAAPAPGVGCHLAVFLRPDGSLRVAAPGGPREVTGEHAAEALARALGAERASCPIRYVAFGAESDDSAWGPVFDVMLEVDRARSAGDARYVLAQAMHPDHP